MDIASQARKQIGDMMKARAGGVHGVATTSGVHFTRIYAFLGGGALGPDNAGRLRAALPEVGDALWADAFAPPPSSEAQA